YMLKLKLYGDVNLDSLEKLPIEMNEDFNIYQSVSDFSEKIVNGKYQASKEFEIAFIPKKSGVLTIPAIEIPFFDINSKSYKTFVIDKKEIKAFGGENIKTTSNGVSSNKNIEKSQDIQPKEKINITVLPEENEGFDFKFLYLIIGGLCLIVLIEGGIILKLIFDKKSSKKSYKNFFKEMKSSKNNKEFYEVYCNFMKEKYNFSPKAQFEDILVKNGGSDDILMINRYIHESLFKNEQIDIIKVIKTLKSK
uniref:BatD family protein n=1 Tax=Fusobacterium sp. TaxID=68766 RepID=UPI00262CFBA5